MSTSLVQNLPPAGQKLIKALTQVVVDTHPNTVQLNQGVPLDLYIKLAALVPENESKQLQSIIDEDRFEAPKALQAYSARYALQPSVRPKNWKQAAEYNTATLATLKKYRGEEMAVATIDALLLQFKDRFGKRADISDNAIHDFAYELLMDYHYFTLADVRFVLNRATENLSDKFSVDYARLSDVFTRAADGRAQYYENLSDNDHLSNKPATGLRQNSDTPMPVSVLAALVGNPPTDNSTS
jgi:hypothetical protein